MKILKNYKKNIKVVLIVLIIGIIIFAVLSILLSYLYYKGIIFPSYAVFKEKSIEIKDYNKINNDSNDFDDLEFDKTLRRLTLKDKKLYAYTDKDYVIWESNPDYKVQDFMWCDIDRDGENELLMLTWKAGRFGTFLPFWIKENDMSFDQHIFIYKFKNRAFKSIWKSSYVEADVKDMSFDDDYKILTLLDKLDQRYRYVWFSWGLNDIKLSKFDFRGNVDKKSNSTKLDKIIDSYIKDNLHTSDKKSECKMLDVDNMKIGIFDYYNKEILLKDERSIKRNMDLEVCKNDINIVLLKYNYDDAKDKNNYKKHWHNVFLGKGIDIIIVIDNQIVRKNELLRDANGNELLIVYVSEKNFKDYLYNNYSLEDSQVEVLKTNHGFKIDYSKMSFAVDNYIDKMSFLDRLSSVESVSKHFENNASIDNIESIKLGAYEQDNNLDNGPEPIEWIVMAKKDGIAYLTSKYILDYIEFDKTKNENKIISGINYKNTYMYYYIYNDFIPLSFTDYELGLIQNKNVSLACNYRYNSLAFDYTIPELMRAIETPYAKSKYVGDGSNEYWILNKCDVSNTLDIGSNREKFVLKSGLIAYEGYRSEDERNLHKMTNIYEMKGFRPFIAIKYE